MQPSRECRLRQICDSSALVTAEPPEPLAGAASAGARAALPAAQQQELVLRLTELVAAGALDECPICMDDVSAPVITPCAHTFCCACLDSWILNEAKRCPLCCRAVTKSTVCPVPLSAAREAAPPEVCARSAADRGISFPQAACAGEAALYIA